MKTFLAVSLMGSLIAVSQTAAAQTVADCAALSRMNCHQTVEMSPKDVQQCMLRGYDAPTTCRKDEGKSSGVRVGGSSGFSYGTVQAPQNPPGAMGAAPVVDYKDIQDGYGMPPWTGFPCKLPGGIDLCAAGATPHAAIDPNDRCPVKSDTSGLFGKKQSLGKAGALNMPCGGAIPLTTYELSMNKNPDHLISTEYGTSTLYIYEKTATGYKKVSYSPLPSYFCKNVVRDSGGKPIIMKDTSDSKGRAKNRSVDLTKPISQIITYGPGTQTIAIRLRSRATPPSMQEYVDWTNMKPKYEDGEPEKYLIIPIKNGLPAIPPDCEDGDLYFHVPLEHADLRLESTVQDACEGPPSQCSGAAATPAAGDTCETVSLRLTNAPAVCKNGPQYFVLDRSNLVYPPGANVTLLPIEEWPAVVAPTVDGSRIYMQSKSQVHLGPHAPGITFAEGGTLALKDKATLTMRGPATVNAANNTVVLSAGGQRRNSAGKLLEALGPGTTYALPSPILPLAVYPSRSFGVPNGYHTVTQSKPAPYVQFPIDK